jgi:hypothetical protein
MSGASLLIFSITQALWVQKYELRVAPLYSNLSSRFQRLDIVRNDREMRDLAYQIFLKFRWPSDMSAKHGLHRDQECVDPLTGQFRMYFYTPFDTDSYLPVSLSSDNSLIPFMLTVHYFASNYF